MVKKNNDIIIVVVFVVIIIVLGNNGIVPRKAVPVETFAAGICVPNSYYNTPTNTELDELGINFMRMDIVWSAVETSKGTYNFIYDSNISNLASHNISVLGILDYGNKLYVTNSSLIVGGKTSSMVPLYDENEFNMFKQGYGEFVYQTVLHYKGRVKYYEIWNEPYWTAFGFNYSKEGNLTVLRYTQLLKEAYTRAKQADSGVVILNGGMGLFWVGHYNLLDDYISEMYDYGAKDYFDIMNIHYPLTTDIDKLINLMNGRGDTNKKIWITEDNQPSYGCHRNGGLNGNITTCPNYTESNQANYLSNQFAYIKSHPRITGYFLFTLWDGTCSGQNYNECNWGLLRGNYSKKPEFYTYKNIISTYLVIVNDTNTTNNTIPIITSGGGGGGGIINIKQSCTSNWNCTIWSTCNNNQSTRTCIDTNNCQVPTNIPSKLITCNEHISNNNILLIVIVSLIIIYLFTGKNNDKNK